MRKIIPTIILMLVMTAASAGAMDIIITVPDAVVPKVVNAVKAAYPNTECEEWDLVTVTCIKQKYTDMQWVKKIVTTTLKEIIQNGQTKLIDAAYAAKLAETKQAEAERITTGESVNSYLTVK